MKNEYNTKQKQILIDFFSSHSEHQLSAGDVALGVKDKGIGKSTVYRQINNLCVDGTIKRFRGDDGKSVLYQYLGRENHCDSHFHLKCTCCGTLIHLNCDSIMKLKNHIKQEHGFTVNVGDSVIYGICSKCSKMR